MPLPFSARPPHPFMGRNNRINRVNPDIGNTNLKHFPLPAVPDENVKPPANIPLPPQAAAPEAVRPPHTIPMAHPPHTAHAQPKPMDAVEHFKRANQNLPDGVQYEPLDKETLQLLRANASGKSNPMPAPPVVSPASTTPFTHIQANSNPALSSHFERLMQYERNAHIFYRYLSQLAHRADMESALSNLSEGADERVEAYGTLMEKMCGSVFTPEETEINTQLNFEDGIMLAVSEENKSLRMLAALLDQVNDNESMQNIQKIINKKIINRNLLSFIKSNTHYPFTL